MKMLKKKYTLFRPEVFTRHPSHTTLRRKNKTIELLPFRSVIRLGSTTDVSDSVTNGGSRVECNTVKAVKNSSDKIKMKELFDSHEVKHPDWLKLSEHSLLTLPDAIDEYLNGYPVIAKKRFRSRGDGMVLINNQEELSRFYNSLSDKSLGNYYIERYYDYTREYRLHVTEDGCFYTCRKMLKNDTPDDKRWYRNDSNCVWMLDTNPAFNKPSNWNDIENECVKALKSTGLDIGACDVKVNKKGDFVVLEINSAPSFGKITTEKYIKKIPVVLTKKYRS